MKLKYAGKSGNSPPKSDSLMAINLDRNNEFRKVKPEAKSDSLMTINLDRNNEFER